MQYKTILCVIVCVIFLYGDIDMTIFSIIFGLLIGLYVYSSKK